MDPRSHVGAFKFKSIGWLPASRMVDQIILNHVFKIKSGQSSHYLAEHFIQASPVHSYSTRFRKSGNFSIPKVKGFGKKSFVYNGCILWNDLPSHIKEFRILKRLLKAFIRIRSTTRIVLSDILYLNLLTISFQLFI